MSVVRTNLGNTRERAGQLRFEPVATISATNVQDAIVEVEADIAALTAPLREVTAAGAVTVNATETGVAINKTVGEATTVNLPPSASRNGLDVIVKDMKGDANTNNITAVPNGSEKIDVSRTQDIINVNLASRRYRPVSGGYLRI